MAKEASKLTKASRELFSKNIDITYGDALPVLQGKGFKLMSCHEFSNLTKELLHKSKELHGFVVEAPSKDLVKYLEAEKVSTEEVTEASMAAALGWKVKRIRKVLNEFEKREKVFAGMDVRVRGKVEKELLDRQQYEAEQNSFNVNKYIFKKNPANAVSSKPVSKKVAEKPKAVPLPPPARKLRRGSEMVETIVATVDMGVEEAIQYAKQKGGVSELVKSLNSDKAKLQALQRQAQLLQENIAKEEAIVDKLNTVKADLKSAA